MTITGRSAEETILAGSKGCFVLSVKEKANGKQIVISHMTLIAHTDNTEPVPKDDEAAVSAVLVTAGNAKLIRCRLTSDGGSGLKATGADTKVEIARSEIVHSVAPGVAFAKGASVRVNECEIHEPVVSIVTDVPVQKEKPREEKSQKKEDLSPDIALLQHLQMASLHATAKTVFKVPAGVHRYDDSLKILGDVTIVGATNDPRDTVIESPDICLDIKEGKARIENVTLRATNGAGEENYVYGAVAIRGGECTLSNCRITSAQGQGIWYYGEETRPQIRRCVIFDCGGAGISVSDSARGTIENCEIYGCGAAGIQVKNSAKPDVKDCKIYNCTEGGLIVLDNGEGTFSSCEIHGHSKSGVTVKDGGDPSIFLSRIYNNRKNGIYIGSGGRGNYESNTLYGNGYPNWWAERGADRFHAAGNSPNPTQSQVTQTQNRTTGHTPPTNVRPKATADEYRKAAGIVYGEVSQMRSQWQTLKNQYSFAPDFVNAMEQTIRRPDRNALRRFAQILKQYTGDTAVVD